MGEADDVRGRAQGAGYQPAGVTHVPTSSELLSAQQYCHWSRTGVWFLDSCFVYNCNTWGCTGTYIIEGDAELDEGISQNGHGGWSG